MLCYKQLMENVSERAHVIFERAAKIIKADILNVEGSQLLDPMDMADSKVSSEVSLNKVRKGCDPNTEIIKNCYLLHNIS